ncbi:hypothetical protein [Bradyrhizobium sp. AZCC 2289]|uniref:hypothetical protein n=1 Tax=Bradyrhizobium sp. AZCC 2289 TaxID=3117026 RepID=UPI002FF2DB5B
MTNGTVKILRKGRDWLKTLVAAMEYSSFDYTIDRISGLEHELKQLKNELRKIRMSARIADGGFDPSAPARET